MQRPTTILELLAIGASDAIAISAPGVTPLTYGQLRLTSAQTEQSLRSIGIGAQDRVALVLPNGPEMAVAFTCIAAHAAAAPLNPAYRADEFEFYLSDLNAKAILVEHGSQSPAIAIAQKLNLQILELHPSGHGAGSFTLTAQQPVMNTASADMPTSNDLALILHTSGTTSRPKIVPLTQANVCASACNVRDNLHLSASDCGLAIMPLFHIHGLIAGLLAPLAAGGQIFCTPGFNALRFFNWMNEAKPSWYTAVPTMHQTIVARAESNREIIQANPLRFIRSSSSSMPPQVIHALEQVFNAPLIESYGMTEAAHQMASNPLPPAKRIPGSVGIAAGPEIAIMDTDGNLLENGATGEIVIRGVNVTAGYENNPKANAEAYTNGWFRTGDQGVLDQDNYLSITGRLKEIINRGGEKISPREVDEILMDHPAVAQVVTFGMPHEKLGEEVAAAVVLREGQQVSEKELREFVAIRLSDYKVPRKILFLEEIPKGATGKLQRIGLAAKLGLA
ncbi:acyl--CoA ligase [Solimicrobium silvestre]|uniref:Acyl-CoA synthetases (AMP-forming)/AMP-acid ligases II n=1 Tax=Solimicrobium silvestre TaxID=2099400 RepID=A0A2S9H516_9BURK|nr:acyl--CoA ligase [Solimicrobium silvestre]PRC94966.1 Acyl-CoA synthetases (AMP-forming)/AMP-acid ligases II [Solimicrobium silvestre]